jgi:hypothetical protein
VYPPLASCQEIDTAATEIRNDRAFFELGVVKMIHGEKGGIDFLPRAIIGDNSTDSFRGLLFVTPVSTSIAEEWHI